MHIVVDLAGYYDWQPLSAGVEPTEADITALRVKPTLDGKWLMKITVDEPTHTTISLPEVEIEDCMAHFERQGVARTRAQVVAWYLAEKVMPHHAHPDHFESIHVDGEPEVEKFLNQYFQTGV